MKPLLPLGSRPSRVVFLWILFAGLALAQETGSIRGAVSTLGPDGQPVFVSGVVLRLQCQEPVGTLQTTTDENGNYSFANIAPGKCRLMISGSGFRQQAKDVEIKAGAATELNLQAELDVVMQNVEVKEREETVSTESSAPAEKVNNKQLESLPLAEEKFTNALPVIPGVIRTPDGKLSIRGSSENEGMLEVDGTKTVDPVTGTFSIPIPIDAVQTVSVSETPFSAQYGGFSGGLARVETKAPLNKWNYKVRDLNVSFRGKGGHVRGVSQATPRIAFGGPLIADKLNFSEVFEYEVIRTPVRGIFWPRNEVKKQGFNSFTSFQAFLSPQHLLTTHINAFPERTQFANINGLLPQSASSDHDRKGISVDLSDLYNFNSGALLTTSLRYTRFDSNAHGQGTEDMLITTGALAGNYFNSYSRRASQFEALPFYRFAPKIWHGRHELLAGVDISHRSFSGVSVSRPVQLLRQDNTLAEKITFQSSGSLSASATDVEEFIQDHWTVNDHLTLEFGGRLTNQTLGRSAAFTPRAALAYSPGKDLKTVIRAGAGLFYERVSLLAGDFHDNPTRVITQFDQAGQILGTPEVLQNVYIKGGAGPIASRIRPDPDTSPRSFVGSFEIDRQLWSTAMLRVNYTHSQTRNLFIVNPLINAFGNQSLLALSNSGASRYHQVETTLHFQPIKRSEMNISYVWSRSRGDLNSLSNLYIPFEQPVFRPNVYGVLPSDVPHRLVGWGILHMPWDVILSPAVDLHTGFPYSSVDVLQNYTSRPNDRRFPTFFSLDAKVYKDFHVPLPFVSRSKSHKVRLGFYSLNVTNHGNYNAVFNNVASPSFGQFTGFERRVNGFLLSVVD